MVDPISAVSLPATGAAPVEQASPGNFVEWLDNEMVLANSRLQEADQAVRGLAVNDTENLHQVMIALSKAEVTFELVTQVRNRLLEGFQEILRMQI
jgi:flagellar hook-basal body complex protein FliE